MTYTLREWERAVFIKNSTIKSFCEHCKKDMREQIKKGKGIYHVCRGKTFCNECWEYLIENEKVRYRDKTNG